MFKTPIIKKQKSQHSKFAIVCHPVKINNKVVDMSVVVQEQEQKQKQDEVLKVIEKDEKIGNVKALINKIEVKEELKAVEIPETVKQTLNKLLYI